jgi:hypothetical protein
MIISLQFPFTTAAGVRIESLELPRPKRSDLKAAQKFSNDAIDQEDFLFCRLTGLVVEDLDQLDVADNKALSDAFQAMASGGEVAEVAGRDSAVGTTATAL